MLTTDKALRDTVMHSPVHLLAFGFGSGLAAKAPGTFGTLAAVPLYCLFALLPLSVYVVILLVAFVAGVWLCGESSRRLGVHDHGGIVWDEFVGFWLTMVAAPFSLTAVVLGFILFRIFDIWKPWPIRWADHRVEGGLGIMLDDVLAGIYAAVCLHLALALIA